MKRKWNDSGVIMKYGMIILAKNSFPVYNHPQGEKKMNSVRITMEVLSDEYPVATSKWTVSISIYETDFSGAIMLAGQEALFRASKDVLSQGVARKLKEGEKR